MDPLYLAIALGPLSVYLLMIGRLNLGRRPFVTSGLRDAMALAIGISGFVLAGPMELFMPEGAAAMLRGWVWLPLAGLYFLTATLLALLSRPRLVIYNAHWDQIRPVLEQVAEQLDPDRRWAGASLTLPSLGVQLSVESFAAMKNVQLVAVGHDQRLPGWQHLERDLRVALQALPVQPNPRGFSLIGLGLAVALLICVALAGQPEEVAQSLESFLRR